MPWRNNIDRETLSELKEYVIDPLTKKIDGLERQIEVQLASFKQDFTRALDHNAATMRAMTDPTTGYVPRSEINMIREKLESQVKESERSAVNQIRMTGAAVIAVVTLILTFIHVMKIGS